MAEESKVTLTDHAQFWSGCGWHVSVDLGSGWVTALGDGSPGFRRDFCEAVRLSGEITALGSAERTRDVLLGAVQKWKDAGRPMNTLSDAGKEP